MHTVNSAVAWVPEANAPVGAGGRVRIGVHDKVSVEATGQGVPSTFAMGGLGVRDTPYDPKEKKIRAAFDLDTSVAAGVGGQRCSASGGQEICAPPIAMERPAGGGWFGAGVAGHFYFFSLFARARVQVTAAEQIAPTFWWRVSGGFQFDILKRAYIYLSTSAFGYVRGQEHNQSWMPVEGGVGIRFGPGSKQKRRRASPPPSTK